MTRHTTAHYFLEALVEIGVDYIFANLGTDHVSLIEELARWDSEGRRRPEVILCPHEVVAVHMAMGYAMMTGRGQAVLVHVDAGTANACMAIQNAFRYRLPVLLLAGRAPFATHGELPGGRDTYVHFVQDSFDQGSIVRPYVKWEYTLPSGVVVKEALARAAAFMHSDPPGPVSMMLPRETLAESWDEAAMPAYPPARYGNVKAGGIEPERVHAVADVLMKAENPIALTAYLGRNAEAVSLLERLALVCGIRVAEFNPVTMNICQDSPCFAGSDPAALIAGADLGLLIDIDVPFIPQMLKAADRLRWIQIDIDALKADIPMWGFATDLRIQGDSAAILRQVLETVVARGDDTYLRRVRDRIASWQPAREAAQAKRISAAAQKGRTGAINPAYVFARLQAHLAEDDIVVNEAVRNAPVLQQQIRRTRPMTYVGLAGGGLGFSGGMALGLKLANPSTRVVQIVGDGAYHFAAPDSVYAVSQQCRLPILSVILDNKGWQAVKASVQRVYPDGVAQQTDSFLSRLCTGHQGEQRRLADIARAFGAHGERVENPDELDAAIERCLAALETGRAAVLHVDVTPL
ncbi:acetolactate synthase [Bradyrhizobium sp. SSBR45G]|uniref:thiamine pyrophosphate-requiring protein n=1 Tax=unclassified Bradyrhizobium TaxID=2631580 RepID=UPI002342AB4C|nr:MULTISPECIES: thiamine pyrophosphate-requiring protein [unclassified Bradyrhizobium]GLH75532.1 acetolactate synthase [Bradyrhizobium sp. SSBR45G]GLH82681.1 acetolactate synthase [Bradyrhizobium sp. SSBR45R]